MRKSGANFEIGPTITEALACFVCSYVDRVMIGAVDRCQRLDEVDSVAFVAPELRPDRVSIDCDADGDRIYRIFKMNRISLSPARFITSHRDDHVEFIFRQWHH